MSLPKPNRNQIAVGVAIAIALAIVGGLAWGFGQQLTRARQIRAEEVRLEQKVEAEQVRYEELTTELEYVQSDEYVERWAREERKMARPGEIAVVVVTDSDEAQTADTQPTPTPTPEAQPFWLELWELFFPPSSRSP
jgi:cell division protein FtsB